MNRHDIKQLVRKHHLLTIEVDDRHLALMQEVFDLGIQAGIEKARRSIEWRINGELWSQFIDEGIEA